METVALDPLVQGVTHTHTFKMRFCQSHATSPTHPEAIIPGEFNGCINFARVVMQRVLLPSRMDFVILSHFGTTKPLPTWKNDKCSPCWTNTANNCSKAVYMKAAALLQYKRHVNSIWPSSGVIYCKITFWLVHDEGVSFCPAARRPPQ